MRENWIQTADGRWLQTFAGFAEMSRFGIVRRHPGRLHLWLQRMLRQCSGLHRTKWTCIVVQGQLLVQSQHCPLMP